MIAFLALALPNASWQKEFNMGIEYSLEGKIALITGASSGLGARAARILAQAGASVVLASRRVEVLKEVRAEIEAEGGSAHFTQLDVTDHASIKSAIAHVETEVGPIDILVNNSGVISNQRLEDVTMDDYLHVMGTNLRGAFFVAQEVAKRMIIRAKSNPNKQYSIINIASVAGLRALPKFGVYCMSKAAMIQMTKSMALEWGQYGINTNAICPGYILTEINAEHFNSEQGQKFIQKLPRKRAGKPEDLDGLLLLLASDESRFINGSIITADDGMSVL